MRCGRRVADCARVCAEESVQRAGGNSGGHRLETRGIYRTIRNPSYLGLLISSLGWVLAFPSVVGVILTTALLVPLVARIRAEERLLREHFGSEYETYCARTWRLLPGIY